MPAFNALTSADIGDDEDRAQPVLFLGEKSKTADRKALAQAKEMAKRRADPHEILKQTGWAQDPEYGRWQYETDDRNFRMAKKPVPGGRFFDAYPHPEVEAAYPDLAKRLRINSRPISNGTFGQGDNRSIDFNRAVDDDSIPLHELQHSLDFEEFGEGGFNKRYDWDQSHDARPMERRANAAMDRMKWGPESRRSHLLNETPYLLGESRSQPHGITSELQRFYDHTNEPPENAGGAFGPSRYGHSDWLNGDTLGPIERYLAVRGNLAKARDRN